MGMSQKRIGFVDYQLDNFHANVYLSALRGPLSDRGYHAVAATAWDAESSRSWAESKGLEYCDSVAMLAERVDYFMILAPANPELHLEMCERVFPFGKSTFVDKTFAPDLSTARTIFELADSCGVAIQTTSALRSSTVQATLPQLSAPLQSMFITSSGPTFAEYGIHPIELAVSCLGAEVVAVMRSGTSEHSQVVLQFSEGRTTTIDFNSRGEVPFSATLVTDDSCRHVEVAAERLFIDAAASILDFFSAGQPQFDRRETLVIRQVLDVLTNRPPQNQFVSLLTTERERAPLQAPHWKQATASSLPS